MHLSRPATSSSAGRGKPRPPSFVSYAWLLDSDRSGRSIHPSTSQKYFHSSDAIDAVTSALSQQGSSFQPKLTIDNAGGKETLRIAFPESVQVSNVFSRVFCGAPAPAADAAAFEVQVPLDLLRAHVSPVHYDDYHGDVLGVAKPWTASSLGQEPAGTADRANQIQGHPLPKTGHGYQKPGEPLLIDWAQIGLSQEQLAEPDTYGATMIPPPEPNGENAARLESLYALAHSLLRDGLAFATSVPTSPTGSVPYASDVAQLYHLARLLGEVRATFYGPYLWDVRSLKQSKNVAYTNADLGFHADLCYYASPPRFQLLHMLKNQVQGGKSLFVDGFAVAEEMWRKHRDEFICLATTPVAFHYDNDGRYYRFAHPTIEIAQPFQGFAASASASFPRYPAGTSQSSSSLKNTGADEPMPRLVAINYSPPFQAPLPLHPPSQLQAASLGPDADPSTTGSGADAALFRRALSTFARLTHDEERFVYARQMQPGECMIFDNRRVLHSRTGFEWDESEEAATGAGAGGKDESVKRWLKGCYVEGDSLWSTYRILRRRVLEQRKE